MFNIERVFCHLRQGGMITPSGGSGFASQMLAMSIYGSPLRSEYQSFRSWVPTFKPSLKSDQGVIEILGMHILEDDSPSSMIHSTDHESPLLFDADLDPSRGLDPAGNCRKCSVEFRLNRDHRNFSTQAARLHSLDIASAASSQRGSSCWVMTSILSCLRWGIKSSHCGLLRRTIRVGRRLPLTYARSIAEASKVARSLMPGAASLARRARWKFSIWVITMPSHSSP